MIRIRRRKTCKRRERELERAFFYFVKYNRNHIFKC
nr:MAG TPA: hypothetical protein [Caudoviricetes sp.]